jgi:tRNA-binding EMAP/Myf-like protein
VGEGEARQICSGLVGYVQEEELQGRLVVVLCNLKARNMVGVKSFGMLMAASDKDHTTVELVCPPAPAASCTNRMPHPLPTLSCPRRRMPRLGSASGSGRRRRRAQTLRTSASTMGRCAACMWVSVSLNLCVWHHYRNQGAEEEDLGGCPAGAAHHGGGCGHLQGPADAHQRRAGQGAAHPQWPHLVKWPRTLHPPDRAGCDGCQLSQKSSFVNSFLPSASSSLRGAVRLRRSLRHGVRHARSQSGRQESPG